MRVKKKLNGVREVDEKSLIDEGRKSRLRLGVGRPLIWGKCTGVWGRKQQKAARGGGGVCVQINNKCFTK